MKLTWQTVMIFGGLLVLLVVGGRSSFLRDPGTFWHIRCGNLMLSEQQFIQQDTFSFTFHGTPWHPHGWIGEILLALLHRLGEWDAILLASGAALAGLYAWLTSRLLTMGLNTVLVLSLLGLVLAASASHFHARPHLLTMIYLGLLGATLAKVELTERFSRLWWMIPLFVLWANTHGGVLAGVASFGLVLLGWLVAWPLGWPGPVHNLRDAVEVCSLGLSALVALFVNPYGPVLVATIIDLARMPELPRIIQEHAPLVWSDPANWPFLACGGVYLGLLAGLREKPRITWLLPLVWFALGISRVRHGSLFGVLMLVSVADLFPQTIWARWLASRRPDFYTPMASKMNGLRWVTAPAVLTLLLGLSLQAAKIPCPVLGRGNAVLDSEHWPVELLPALRQQYSPANPRLFNELNHGGFIMFFTPEFQHFVDDRCELFGGAWLERYVLAERDGTAAFLADMEARYGRFDVALTLPSSGYDRHFSHQPEWVLVQRCPAGALFRRVR